MIIVLTIGFTGGAFTQGTSLEEIKEDMEKNGLVFDKKMFSKEV